MSKKHLLLILLITLAFYSCKKSPIEGVRPISVSRPFKKALWIVRHSISSKKKADAVIAFTKKYGFDTLVVQVRGRSDAYYNSSIEPVAYDVERGFDPLGYLNKKCKELNIELHAWINMTYGANITERPLSPGHVLFKHPDWATYDKSGKNLMSYDRLELRNNLVDGAHLDPAIPDVIGYTVRVVEDIVRKYDIKGIHYDFIRYPWSGFSGYYKRFLKDYGYNPVARMRFIEKYAIDPEDIPNRTPSTYRELFRDFRRDRINELVQKCSYAIKKIRPNIIISAAVIANAPVARKVYFQDWKEWIKRGYLDMVFPMSYSQYMDEFIKYMNVSLDIRNKLPIYMGVHIKKHTKVKLTAEQIRLIYKNNFYGFCVFSYSVGKNKIIWLNKLLKYSPKKTARTN